MDNARYIRKKLRFYLIFYLFFFSSIFSLRTFFTNIYCIILLSILLWTPQIIYNIYSNNKYSYPIIFIIACTIERLSYPFYFRGYKENFLGLKEYNILFIVIFAYISLTIIFLYIQLRKGPYFLLPLKYQKNGKELYKTKEEILLIKPDIENEDCVICLLPLIEKEEISTENKVVNENKVENEQKNDKKDDNKNTISPNERKNKKSSDASFEVAADLIKENQGYSTKEIINSKNISKENERKAQNNQNISYEKLYNNNSLKISVKDDIYFQKNKSNKYKIYCFVTKIKFIFYEIYRLIRYIFSKNFFIFNKGGKKLNGKPYMVTPCNHFFHSECIEEWIERKKECPNCRTSLGKYFHL